MGEKAPVLVGRHRELAEARAAIGSGFDGAGGLLLVAGEAGIGRTRLVEALAAQAGEWRARVLWGTCWDDPGTPAFWPWAAVLRDCADFLGADVLGADVLDPGADADLAPITGAAAVGEGPAEQLRLRLFASVAGYLRRAARRRPLLIVLEDLHAADAASLHLLRLLAGDLRGPPVVIVGTYRYPDLPPDAPLAAVVGELGRVGRTVTLSGLDQHEVGELIRVTTGQPPLAGLAARVRERTGGNPLFVTEVAKLLVAQGRTDAEHLPIPQGVRQAISHRLAYVGTDTLDVLAHAAVVGQTFPAALLQHVTGRPPGRLADLLGEASDAGLVRRATELGPYVFTHALVQEVLYAGIPAALRRRRHRLVAEAIEALHRGDLDEHAAELADHSVLALPDADPAHALDWCRKAGGRALRMLAYEDAARYFARAVELAGTGVVDEAVRVELQLARADALLRSGDRPAATGAYEEVAAAARRRGRPDELARAALGLGAGLSGFEVRLFDRHQIDLLREALRALGADDPALRAWVQARLSVAESFVVAEEVRVGRSARAVASAREVGDPRLLAYALSSYCDAIPGPARAEERLALADEMIRLGIDAEDPESELLGRRFRVVALLESGDLVGVDVEIEEFTRTAARLRWPLVEWYPPLWRGTQALLQGRLDTVEQSIELVKDIGRRASSVNAQIAADVQRLQLLLEQRRPAEAFALLRRFLDDPEGGPNAEVWTALPLARMGRHAEARAALDRLAAAGFPLVVDAAWLEVIASVAEACAEVRHQEAAAALLPILTPHAGRFATGGTGAVCFGSLSRHLGLLTRCLDRWDESEAHFRRALAANRRAGATLQVAHTLREHAGMLHARAASGDRARADAMLAEAAAIYTELGLGQWTTPAGADEPSGGGRNLFRRDGDSWTLRYAGREVAVRDSKGMAVLARLLAEPAREFHVLDLVTERGRDALGGDAGELLDARARREYRQRLAALAADIDEAERSGDARGAERAARERDALVAQLSAAYGLGGRVRRTGDPAERARSTVTKQIHGAIARIRQAHPALAVHLSRSVTTGRYCGYAPEHPLTWELAGRR